jgi:hypothetical protein
MSASAVLRSLACAIAVAAAVDFPVRVGRPAPVTVSLRDPTGALARDPGVSAEPADAIALRSRLAAAMPDALAINTGAEPRAVIVAGRGLEPSALPERGPVSFVSPEPEQGPHARVVSVTNPRPVLPGWAAVFTAEIEGRGVVAGSSSTIVLESQGIEVDRVEHKWGSGENRFTARLSFAPPAPGSYGLAVRALPSANAAGREAEPMPARVVSEQRRLKILAFDPRPSWGAGFVRRVLEGDPDFDVAARVRASRGLDVRTGAAPLALSEDALNPFDLVMVGAPEELTSAEIASLEAFARRRGGTVVLIADRKPSGPYPRLLGVEAFEEVLVEKPVRIAVDQGIALRASELACPRALPAGAEALVTLPQRGGSRAAVVAIPVGAGRVVFSGLLDAWRYRGEDGNGFAAFWRSRLGQEAERAPRRLEVTLNPAAATPGSVVRIRAAVRATDQKASEGILSIPAIAAQTVDERGRQQIVRLWPTSEAGVFEGTFVATRAGRYDVRVETEAGTSVDTPLSVGGREVLKDPGDGASLPATIAQATGGVAVTTRNIDPLVEQLRALSRDAVPVVRYPMRSPWWAVAFVGLLSAEWLTRRRRGLR